MGRRSEAINITNALHRTPSFAQIYMGSALGWLSLWQKNVIVGSIFTKDIFERFCRSKSIINGDLSLVKSKNRYVERPFVSCVDKSMNKLWTVILSLRTLSHDYIFCEGVMPRTGCQTRHKRTGWRESCLSKSESPHPI